MSSETNRASLLGLPPELRLKIYGFMCHVDINCTILQDIEHIFRRGAKAKLIPNPEANLALSVPWINLPLTCRTICSELKSFMAGGPFLSNEDNRIYVLELDVYNDKTKAIRKAVWRKVPCPPEHAQILQMNIVTVTGDGPWTEGGPASLARAVYQMLNHTCHNGPRMVRRRPLPNHMQVKDLTINIDIGLIIKPPRSDCNTDPQFNYSQLVNGFQQISRAGLLFGYVGNIKVREVDKSDEHNIKVGSRPPAGVPGSWQNYGFFWGV